MVAQACCNRCAMTGATSAHFSNEELRCSHCLVNGCHQVLVDALESLRTLISTDLGTDTPIHVDSAYRCDQHNTSLPNSAKHSQHTLGIAADIRVAGLTAAQLYHYAQQIPAFKGIGRDDHAGYIHVDCRSWVARWCYDSQGKVMAWYDPSTPMPAAPATATVTAPALDPD